MKKATSQQTKQFNRDLILRTIFNTESISRADIARDTGLTRTTVSDVVSGLISEGLVEEIGKGESIGGKTPILLSIIPDSRFLIGLNLAQEQFIGAVVNLRGEIKETFQVPVLDAKGDEALEYVIQIISNLKRKSFKPIVGIGVGTPGLVNTRMGLVINAVNLGWKELPLGSILQKKFRLPVSILNDSQATAIGEFVYGTATDHESNRVVVNVNHGVGAGILIHGRLFQGDDGSAGEIGHVVVQENGLPCRCGKNGCLESVSSTRAVLSQLNKTSIEEVQKTFESGDKETVRVIMNSARYLGVMLAGLVGALNINRITLTGDMARFGAPWLEGVTASMHSSAFSQLSEKTTVEIGKLGYQACILGASAYLLLDDYSLLFMKETKANAVD